MEIWAKISIHPLLKISNSVRQISYLLLGVGPARDLDNHVEDGLLVIGVEGDIVEGRDRDTILLDVYPVLQGVGLADFSRDERHCGRL